MSKTDLSHAVAAASATLSIHVPIAVYLSEAVDVAKVLGDRWDPVKDGKSVKMPGLSSIAHKKTSSYAVTEHTADEIQQLVTLAREAQTQFRLAQNPHLSREDLDQASHALGEIEAALEFLFDDGKEDASDAALASLDQAHAHDTTIADEAQALDDYGTLAKAHRKELDGLGDFDVTLIDRAHPLAEKLRARDAARAPSPEATSAMETRNRILNTLAVRVNAARSGVRFVFRKHPEVQRSASSAYERRKRSASRRAAAKAKATTPATTTQ